MAKGRHKTIITPFYTLWKLSRFFWGKCWLLISAKAPLQYAGKSERKETGDRANRIFANTFFTLLILQQMEAKKVEFRMAPSSHLKRKGDDAKNIRLHLHFQFNLRNICWRIKTVCLAGCIWTDLIYFMFVL